MTSGHNLGAELHIDLFFPTFDLYCLFEEIVFNAKIIINS